MPEPLDIGVTVGGPGASSVLEALHRVGEARVLALWGVDGESARTGRVVELPPL